jgi:hypothetical protein
MPPLQPREQRRSEILALGPLKELLLRQTERNPFFLEERACTPSSKTGRWRERAAATAWCVRWKACACRAPFKLSSASMRRVSPGTRRSKRRHIASANSGSQRTPTSIAGSVSFVALVSVIARTSGTLFW